MWIVIGAVFDFFDGMSARLLGVSSPIGKELDSLADVVTFGVAPSMLLFNELHTHALPDQLEPLRFYLPFVAFLMAAFSALRLAKFNLDERQAMGFIGLPTPANALFWGSLLVGAPEWLHSTHWIVFVLVAGLLISCWLLVSEIPMFALKFKHWGFKGNEIKYGFVIFSAIALACGIAYGIKTGDARIYYSPLSVIILAYIAVSIATQKK